LIGMSKVLKAKILGSKILNLKTLIIVSEITMLLKTLTLI